MEKYRTYADIIFYKQKKAEAQKAIDHLKKTGWEITKETEKEDMISGGVGSQAWEEPCIIVIVELGLLNNCL